MITEWTISKLENVKDFDRVLLIDSFRLLSESDTAVHGFAQRNGFTVIIASTNLVFRELYEKAVNDNDVEKLLIIDRAPASRRKKTATGSAPPPFYPDLMDKISPEAKVELDLRQFLIEQTGDPNWSSECNSRLYAPLISRHLKGVLRAHKNLRTADADRFTDNDFYRIVSYASLGVPESAFRQADARTYWQIGLLGHEKLEDLESIAPEIIQPIKNELGKAPAPFCWFSAYPAETVLRTSYLAVILQQHYAQWNLLLANIDPGLLPVTDIQPETLKKTVPELIALDPEQARKDISAVEASLDAQNLSLLLFQQKDIRKPDVFADFIEKEKYSLLFRSLGLLAALHHLMHQETVTEPHHSIHRYLFADTGKKENRFIDAVPSPGWSHLKECYLLTYEVQKRRQELKQMLKMLSITDTAKLNFSDFWEFWNKKQVNRMEYYLSRLERRVLTGDLLPGSAEKIPDYFSEMTEDIRKQVRKWQTESDEGLRRVNLRFQETVALQYPGWISEDSRVILTHQFLRRCLRPHWDLQKEKAAVFIFDGMRYDIWDELLKPLIQDRAEIIADDPASAILPTETHITRKAISAGVPPDHFHSGLAENILLKEGLQQVFGQISEDVKTLSPEGTGAGETVRYRCGNLDVYIFELCDKELHKVSMKKNPDGTEYPSRPLTFIYRQHIKNIIETEFMSVFRGLSPGTKVFITADHGFGPVGREALWFQTEDMNELSDCLYMNCRLRVSAEELNIPLKVRKNIITFTPEQLRMPVNEDREDRKTGQTLHKIYKCIAFPKPGFSFSRTGSPFRPDAWSHGGISIQEMMIPMVVMKIRTEDTGIFSLEPIQGPGETVEGESVEFTMRIRPKPGIIKPGDELRLETESLYSKNEIQHNLPDQVLYISEKGEDAVCIFTPDSAQALPEERKQGMMERILTIKVSCREGGKMFTRSETLPFRVKLNSDRIVRRVPSHLGNILGLTPKSMR